MLFIDLNQLDVNGQDNVECIEKSSESDQKDLYFDLLFTTANPIYSPVNTSKRQINWNSNFNSMDLGHNSTNGDDNFEAWKFV